MTLKKGLGEKDILNNLYIELLTFKQIAMRKLIFLALLALPSISNAQFSNVLIGAGVPMFIGSAVYYAVGEPVYDVTNNTQANFNAYNQRLTRYKNTRTIALASSSLVLLSGVILKTTEIKTSKNTSMNITGNGIIFTARF